MSYPRRYKQRDFHFAHLLVTLRRRTGLTQEEVALKVGVAGKSIRNWEGGSNYPTELNLQKLLELYLDKKAFEPGHEREEARTLWEQFQESTHHSSSFFDEQWFETALQQALTRRTSPQESSGGLQTNTPSSSIPHREDWGEALDVPSFAGRAHELTQLEHWVLDERSRLVAVLGMGGIGKTALVTTFAHHVAPHFDVVIWRSLHHAPGLEQILNDCLLLLGDQPLSSRPQDLDQRLSRVIEGLRQRRCLLILDNVETLFQEGERAGSYRPGYEEYRIFFLRAGEHAHQSCLLLTSRETPAELDLLGTKASVRVLKMAGLPWEESRAVLQDKVLFGEQQDWRELSERYTGNPLALKIVTGEVRELFGGDLAAFLREGHLTFQGVRALLREQVERLSALEQEVLYWLAIERDLTAVERVRADMLHKVPAGDVLEALSSLRRRSLIERGERGAVFTLQPVILEYMTDRLVEQVCHEILTLRPELLLRYALLQAQARDYIRSSQRQLILQAILDRLLLHLRDKHHVEECLDLLIQQVRSMSMAQQGYAGGNLVNLLGRLNGHIKGKDCSQLAIWQADLQEVEARNANFAGADLTGSVFLETMESIRSVALSPNEQYVAAGTCSGKIHIWSATNGQLLLTLAAHAYLAWSVAFNPESTRLASGGYDGLVKLWDVSNGHCLSVLQGHTKWVRSVTFHPSGELLATSSQDGSIRLWDATAGRCIKAWHEQRAEIWSVAFSPDGRLLASGDATGLIRLWDLERDEYLWTTTASPDSLLSGMRTVTSLAFSSDGELLVSAGLDYKIRVWETARGKPLSTGAGHIGPVFSVAFNAEGLLASGSQDGTIKLWQIGQRGETAHCLETLQEHRQQWIWSVTFGPGGLLASGSQDGTVQLWQVNREGRGGKCLRTLHGYSQLISSMAFSQDGKLLMSSEDNGTVRIWETWSGKVQHTLSREANEAYALAFSPDGRICAQNTPFERTITLWDVDSGHYLRTLQGHRGYIWSVTFSPDGHFLLSGSLDTTVKLWEVESGRCLTTFEGHTNWALSVAWSPDGARLASGDGDGVVNVWDLGNRQCVRTLHNSSQSIIALTFTPDSKTLLSANAQGMVSTWNIESGECLKSLLESGESYWLGSASLSADGSLLATASADQSVKVWEVSSGQLLRTFKSHPGRPRSLAWSADRCLLACGTDEGSILLWEQITGQCLMILRSDRPYERMNINRAIGITPAQRASLKTLGAIEIDADPKH